MAFGDERPRRAISAGKPNRNVNGLRIGAFVGVASCSIQNVHLGVIFHPFERSSLHTYLWTDPSRKRGPPKGYLHTVERRLHETQAVLGIILSVHDPRAVYLVSELCREAYASHVLARVSQSAFGPAGRKLDLSKEPSSEYSVDSGVYDDGTLDSDPFVAGPTNAWQDHVIKSFKRFGNEHVKRETEGKRPILAPIRPIPQRHYPIPDTPSASTSGSDLNDLRPSRSPVSPVVSPTDHFPLGLHQITLTERNSSGSDSSGPLMTSLPVPYPSSSTMKEYPRPAIQSQSTFKPGGLQLYTFDDNSMAFQLHSNSSLEFPDGNTPFAFFHNGYESTGHRMGWWPEGCEG